LLAGLALATVWLSPLILLVVLMTAWFRGWGWVILIVGIGLGSELLKRVFGEPLLSNTLLQLMAHAATSFIHGGGGTLKVEGAQEGLDALRAVPVWALGDLGASLRDLASPLLVGALAFAAACFALLVEWRRRGASAAA
jgi:ABC-2 type transport system permease protein